MLAVSVTLAGCSSAARTPAASPTTPVTAASAPSPAASPSSSASPPPGAAWLTYHGDPSRTGLDATSPPLQGPAPAWRTASLDGPIWAEPLVDGDRVLVATEGGSLYALAAGSGAVLWRTHLDDPMPRSRLPCGDVSPLGITGTPVIDPGTQTLFAVAERSDAAHELVAVSVGDGAVLWRRVIDASGSDALDQQQRAALALAAGRVLVAFGGLDGDCGTYKGYVVSVPESGTGPVATYVLPVANGGGIWAPSGPAVGGGGEVFVASGNSTVGASSAFDHSNSVIALTPTLSELGYFAPADWRRLSAADLDLGSTGPLLDQGSVLVAGKDGVLYLLDASALGGVGGQRASLDLGSGAFGGLALDGQTALVPTVSHLDAVTVRALPASLTLAWRGPATWPAIVAGGAVWAVTRASSALVALSPATGAVLFSLPLGSVEHFTTPAAALGWVYVASGAQVVAVRGA
jgi:outer membrane protein assembly factor BamB